MKKQGGFSAVEAMLVVLVVVLIGIVGWVAYTKHHPATTTGTVSTNKTVTTKTTTVATKTYTSKEGKFTLTYPETWTVSNDNSKITSPNGVILNISAITTGGYDFGCAGDPTACSSVTNLSATDTGKKALLITADNAGNTVANETPILLITQSQTDSKTTTYYIGLSAGTSASYPLNTPQPGVGNGFGDFLFTGDNNQKSGYPLIAIWSQSTDSAFLKSADAVAIAKILKSFTYTQ